MINQSNLITDIQSNLIEGAGRKRTDFGKTVLTIYHKAKDKKSFVFFFLLCSIQENLYSFAGAAITKYQTG